MFRPNVLIIFISIIHNEIQKSCQSVIELTVPTADTVKPNIGNLTSDKFINKPNETTEKNEDIATSTKHNDVADNISNGSKGRIVTDPIANSKEDIFHNDKREMDTNNSLRVTNSDISISGNNNNDMNGLDNKAVFKRHLQESNDAQNDKPLGDVTKASISAPGSLFSNFPPMSFLQRFAGRMIIPMIRAHQKLSDGVLKGVHGVREVGSGTYDIAEGTFNIIKDTARSIFNTKL